MKKFKVWIEQKKEAVLYGVWGKMSDRTAAKDIPALSSEFHRISQTREGGVLPFFVLSRNYDEHTGFSELFIGSLEVNENLDKLILPQGEYAVMTVKPKFLIFWGIAVGEAKRFFYKKWLPKSDFCTQNMEYEYHTEKTIGKKPMEDIVFAISRK